VTRPLLCVRRPKALADIDGHASKIANDNLEAALRFLDKVDETVRFVSEFPESGGRFGTERAELKGIRAKLVIDFPRYSIFYFYRNDLIEVVRVLGWGQEVDPLLIGE